MVSVLSVFLSIYVIEQYLCSKSVFSSDYVSFFVSIVIGGVIYKGLTEIIIRINKNREEDV